MVWIGLLFLVSNVGFNGSRETNIYSTLCFMAYLNQGRGSSTKAMDIDSANNLIHM